MAFPSTSARTFDWASFSQHGTWYRYLRENLSCDGEERGSCGTDTQPGGERVTVYVANNSHANYPQKCAEQVEYRCMSHEKLAGFIDVYEGGHDGDEAWGNNEDRTGPLLRFPPAVQWTSGARSWVTWPGLWGPDSNSPASPGNQPHFGDPEEATCGESTGCSGSRSMARGVPSTSASNRPDRSGAPAICESWFGGSVAAVACDPPALGAASTEGRLGRAGSLSITDPDGGTSSADAPGLAQLVRRPLKAGGSLLLSGQADSSTNLLLRVQDGSEVSKIRFDNLGLSSVGEARVEAVQQE